MAKQDSNTDFTAASQQMYDQWEKAMTSWWDQVLESPAFLGAMGKNLGQQAQARARYEETVDTAMEQMHLPTRSDLVRVARIATLLEDKLLAIEDRVLEIEDKLTVVESEAVKARIEAAEARLELRESLAGLHTRLAAIDAKLELQSTTPRSEEA